MNTQLEAPRPAPGSSPPPPTPTRDDRRARRLTVILFVVGALLVAVIAAVAGRMSAQGSVDDARSERDELIAETNDMTAEIKALKTDLAAAQGDFADTEVCAGALDKGRTVLAQWDEIWATEMDWYWAEIGSAEEAALDEKLVTLLNDLEVMQDDFNQSAGECRAALPTDVAAASP